MNITLTFTGLILLCLIMFCAGGAFFVKLEDDHKQGALSLVFLVVFVLVAATRFIVLL